MTGRVKEGKDGTLGVILGAEHSQKLDVLSRFMEKPYYDVIGDAIDTLYDHYRKKVADAGQPPG